MRNRWRGSEVPVRLRVIALSLGLLAAVAMVIVGCTSVTSGTVTVDKADAPLYRASVSASAAESAESSSSKESERQESVTTSAIHTSCEALSSTSVDAITAVNDYVGTYNENGDVAAAAGPAADALNQSADTVERSLTDPLGPDLRNALTEWVSAARAVATAISADVGPDAFNDGVGRLNDAKSAALDMCDKAYR
jgi:cytoskeletal protein RodZ